MKFNSFITAALLVLLLTIGLPVAQAEEISFVVIPPLSGPNYQGEVFIPKEYALKGDVLRFSIRNCWRMLESDGVRVYLAPDLARKWTASNVEEPRFPNDAFDSSTLPLSEERKAGFRTTLTLMRAYAAIAEVMVGTDLHYEPLIAGVDAYRRPDVVNRGQFAQVLLVASTPAQVEEQVLSVLTVMLQASGVDSSKYTGVIEKDWATLFEDITGERCGVVKYDSRLNVLLVRTSKEAMALFIRRSGL